MRPSDGLLSARPCWRGDNWIISPGNQLEPCASDGTRVKQRLVAELERWGGGGGVGRGRMTALIDDLRHRRCSAAPHPSFSHPPPALSPPPRSLVTPRPPSIADPPNKSPQIGHFHLNELSPNKRQGSGGRLQTPKYPPITRANGPTMQKRRAEVGGGGRGETLKMYLYMVKKMLIGCWENGGDLGGCLIPPLFNSRADGRD